MRLGVSGLARWRATMRARAGGRALAVDLRGVVVANTTSPNQTVVSGRYRCAIESVIAAATSRNIVRRRLPVSNAFHSPLVADGAKAFEAAPRRAAVAPEW